MSALCTDGCTNRKCQWSLLRYTANQLSAFSPSGSRWGRGSCWTARNPGAAGRSLTGQDLPSVCLWPSQKLTCSPTSCGPHIPGVCSLPVSHGRSHFLLEPQLAHFSSRRCGGKDLPICDSRIQFTTNSNRPRVQPYLSAPFQCGFYLNRLRGVERLAANPS